jgi:hypothetical protein
MTDPDLPGKSECMIRRELVDSGFRALHTIKGAGAMFGFDKIAVSLMDVQHTPCVGMHRKPEYLRFISKWREEFVIVPKMERILD